MNYNLCDDSTSEMRLFDILLCCNCKNKTDAIFHASILFFTITAEIHARSLVNFCGQYTDRHMNLKFMRRVSEREQIRQFVIVKNKLISVFDAPVLLLTMNFVITLRIHSAIASWIHSYFDNVMTKFMINNRTDA